MARKPAMISRTDLRKAFNRYARTNQVYLDFYPDIRTEMEKCFRGKNAGPVSSRKLYTKAQAISGPKTARKSFTDAANFNFLKYRIATDVLQLIPAIAKENAAAQKQEEQRREKERGAFARREQKHKNSRVGRLEQEVASLRQQLNSRPRTAEEILAEREYWEKNDTRIGGSYAPNPPGLRD